MATEITTVLATEGAFTEERFFQLFPVSRYTFPFLPKDAKGFVTHQPDLDAVHYSHYQFFDVSGPVPQSRSDPRFDRRDLEVEQFMATHFQEGQPIMDVEIDLKAGPSNSASPFKTTVCSVYPLCIRDTVLFDILYECDYLFKFMNRFFLQIVFDKKSGDVVGENDFIIAREVRDGRVHVAKTTRRAGYVKLKNTIRFFALLEKGNVEQWKVGYDKYKAQGGDFRAQLTFHDVHVAASDDGKELFLSDLRPLVLVDAPPDHPGHFFKKFVECHYFELKRAFPVYQRLEIMFKYCAVGMHCAQGALRDRGEGLQEVGVFADSFYGLGGIRAPHRIVHMPSYTPMPRAPKADPVKRVYVIRRALEGVPLPAVGALAHSALLLETASGKQSILEYGVGDDHNQVALTSIDQLDPTWTKQARGDVPDRDVTPEDMLQIMEMRAPPSYNAHDANCHLVQQRTREAVGIRVENPYAPLW
jgi:hypothetical protein